MKKKEKMHIAIILILFAATGSSLGQFVWKIGVDSEGIKSVVLYLLGFILSGVGMVLLMLSFRFGEVSILQPMMSIGFALSVFLGALFLHELVTPAKLLGIFLIILGSALLGYEGGREDG
ncbi:EamA family transporter [Vagococcus sp.]|uniref:EamA family transporter n=1 Tax=Vagococcus sp. TaxID=1933889 RepID=UPI003F9C65B4